VEFPTVHTLIVDSKKRVRCRRPTKQVFAYEPQGEGRFLLTRLVMEEPPETFPRGSLRKYLTRAKAEEELALLKGCSLERRSEGPVRRLALRLSREGRASGGVDLPSGPLCPGALVNVLYCTSQRQSRAPHPYEVLLNGADGMDGEPVRLFDSLHGAERAALRPPRTRVVGTARQIRVRVRDLLRLNAMD